jgi:putative transposase
MRAVAMDFYEKGHSMGLVLRLLGLRGSTFYYKASAGLPGRPPSTHTPGLDGTMVPNGAVVGDIMELLATDFVDYGYRKVAEWLRWHKRYVLNDKKVLRLMRENRVMLPKRTGNGASGRRRVTEKVPQPSGPRQRIEVDIKYVRVHGKGRNAMVVNFVDLFHREWLPFHVGWTIRKGDLVRMLGDIFGDVPLAATGLHLVIRTDNGSQFIAIDVATWMGQMGISHEFIHPATPEENAHVESFHSVMQRAMVGPREFESLTDLQDTLARFSTFYNH